jgi:hypothetical protein
MSYEELNSINALTSIPSIGSLLGTSVSPDLINQINSNLPNSGVFGTELDPFKKHHEYFMEHIVNPIIETQQQIEHLQAIASINDNQILSIWNQDMLQFSLPQAMRLPILLYPPIMELYKKNAISGWDMNVPKDQDIPDIYGEMIEGVTADMEWDNEEGYVGTCYCEDDWDLSLDEIEDIKETREFLDKFLQETDLDPTNPSSKRG